VPAPAAKPPFPWWIVIVAATIVVIVGGIGGYLMMRERAPQQSDAATPPGVTAAVPPPTTPQPAETVLPCSQEKGLRSPQSGTAASSLEFVNSRNAVVKIYWLDAAGQRKPYRTLNPGQAYTQGTFVSHPWVVTDAADACLTIFRPAQSSDRVVIR
jgi:hypothetical protein